MFDFTGLTSRLLRKLTRPSGKREEARPGVEEAVDGRVAVALTEALMSDALVAGPTHTAGGGGREVLERDQDHPQNLWGRRIRVLDSGGAGDVLASAHGLALSGNRTAAFLSGHEAASSLPLFVQAAGRLIPLVTHVVSQSHPAAAVSGGGGYDAVHAIAETGALTWVAADVQEAIDFSLMARRVCEEALLPGVVVMDGEETALSVQNACLPDAEVVRRFVGDPAGTIHPPAPAQEILFGKHRRRVPRWHDPERPFLTGPAVGGAEFSLGHAGRFAYLDAHLSLLPGKAFEELALQTGRRHEAVSAYRVEDAHIVLVGLGGTIRTLEAAADRIRKTEKIKVGVVGIRLLNPFPADSLVECLRGKKTVAVLESVTPRVDAEPPLLRTLRSVLGRRVESTRFGDPAPSPLKAQEVPRLCSVYCGLGGLPPRIGDLSLLCRELVDGFRTPVFLGVEFNPEISEYPKRQVLLDTLRRYYPGSEKLGLRSRAAAPAPATAAIGIHVHRVSGHEGEGLVGEAARLLWEVGAGSVRSRAVPSWDHWGTLLVDRLLLSPDPRSLDSDAAASIAVWRGNGLVPPAELSRDVRDGGVLVVERPSHGSFWETLPGALQEDIQNRKLNVVTVKTGSDFQDEFILGAVIAAWQERSDQEISPRKLLSARRALFEELPPAEIESRVAAFQAGMNGLVQVETGGLRPTGKREHREAAAPRVVRRLRRTDETMDSLSRFWDQVGVLYQRGEAGDLVPDPYLGVGVMPPLSSAFRDLSPWREVLPEFDPARCTGCGDCWSVCPDSAMTPVVLPTATFLESGMQMAKENGHATDVLRRFVSKLSGHVNTVLEKGSHGTAGGALPEAFTRLTQKTSLPEDKKDEIEAAFTAVREALEPLPLACTAPFFHEAEKNRKGTGELFSLAVSPDACKGCALCVAVCDPGALTSLPQDPRRIGEARMLWQRFESLPDPSEETLERAREQVGPVAAALLTREVREAFSGGDGAEPGSGEKIAFRQILAVVHHRFRPRYREHVARVQDLRDRLGAAVRENMAQALPAQNLDELSRGLGSLDRPEINLTDLSRRIETAFEGGRVDVTHLKRVVDVGRAVNDLEWRLTRGEGGLGESPFGLVIGPGSVAAWASAFPNNPFGVPVVIHPGKEAAAMARGLLEGQVDRGLASAAVLRQAELELEDPKEAARQAGTPPPVWEELTVEERKLIPPLLLVVCENALSPDLGGLFHLLTGELPVKVLVFTELDMQLGRRQGGPFPMETAARGPEDLGLLVLAHGRAYVGQTSVSHPDHLDATLGDALEFDGPALVRVYTPSPERHGFAKDAAVDRAASAVVSRVHPLFRCRPTEGRFRLDLSGNPDPDATWASGEDGPVNPLDWARGDGRFAHHFTSADDSTEEAVSPELSRIVGACQEVWETLRSLAAPAAAPPAEAPPAAEPVPAESGHEAELAALREHYEERIAGLSDELRVGMALRVRTRLLDILRRNAGNGKNQAAETGTETAVEEDPSS